MNKKDKVITVAIMLTNLLCGMISGVRIFVGGDFFFWGLAK